MTFTVKNGVSGDQDFSIQVTNNGTPYSRSVSVPVESTSSISNVFKGNSLAWIIGIVNAILIILIIVVAVRLSRK